MTTVQEASVAARTGNATASAAPSAGEVQERFLKLLVTQMQNQDPLNPLDNTQVTTQLAQLNTVSGINQLNDTMQSLAAGFAAAQTLQSAALIGRGVVVPGSQVLLSGGQALFGAEFPMAVDRLQVEILDVNGKILHRVDVGPQQAGIVALQWDGSTDSGGKAADGRYQFRLSAVSGGKPVDVTSLVVETVRSVTPASRGLRLNLDGTQSVSLGDIRQII